MTFDELFDPEPGDLDFAMEMTTAQFSDFMQGRKVFFNTFYERVVKGMRKNENRLMHAIALYRDKNVEILSSPYLCDYTKFNPEDAEPLYRYTSISEEEVDQAVRELKKFIKQNCHNLGINPPDFANTTPFRMLLILVMRYFIERGDKKKLDECCSYYAYSMFYTIYYNYFRNMKPRRETMMYVMANMSNKFKIKQEKTVDGMISYSVKLCANTYTKRILDCTDQDMMYVIGQIKSRMRDFIKNIKNAYVKADKDKQVINISAPTLPDEEGTKVFIDKPSTMGEITALAQQYTNAFIQKNVDMELVKLVARLDEVSRNEISIALDTLRRDSKRIPQVEQFYSSIFYIYLSESNSSLTSVHSKDFMAAMEAVYKRGNTKDSNVNLIKKLINEWLEATSPMYRQTQSPTTLNNLRRSIFHYFVFLVVMRR